MKAQALNKQLSHHLSAPSFSVKRKKQVLRYAAKKNWALVIVKGLWGAIHSILSAKLVRQVAPGKYEELNSANRAQNNLGGLPWTY